MDIDQLNTEQANPDSFEIEKMTTKQITSYINREDQKVPLAVAQALPAINSLIDATISQLQQGGRIIYVGAGTSGRLGILDASECPPTYGVEADLVQGIIAGGNRAIHLAQEGAEDDRQAAKIDLSRLKLSDKDMVIGLTASGRTPYVTAALEYAHEQNAQTGSISCVKNAEISTISDYPIEVLVGPEVITGSSRMKAGTAQKLILNMISTTSMIRLGKIYKGYMVDVKPTNEKLVERAHRIIQKTTGANSQEARDIFEKAKGNVKLAILMQLGHLTTEQAENMLLENHQNIALSIKTLLQAKENTHEC